MSDTQLCLWRDFVRTISTGALPFRLEVRPGSGEGPDPLPILAVTLGVKDIADGHDTIAGTREPLPAFPGTSGFEWHPTICANKAEKIVHAVVERVWLHELREHWSVGHQRVRDPHTVGPSDGVGRP